MVTPEARMGDGSCPMHESNDQQDDTTRIATQTDADRCCAASEQHDPAPPPSSLAGSVTLATAFDPVPALLPEPEAHAALWRASVPISPPHVPRYLLLSVFLV
jgi:hypothetical protein